MISFNHLKQEYKPLYPIRRWLEVIEIRNAKLARFLCKLIPSQCPFERNIIIFGRKLIHIPCMCQLNPLYNEIVGLRFKALCYLADNYDENIT